jgi:phage baseplate assembly protein W
MAIILGSKLVKDLEEKDKVAIGITLPIQRGNTGYFQQSFQTSEQVKSNIRNLMLTVPGERLMQPDFGTRLWNLLFSQNTELLESDIESAIQTALSTWMPYVRIEQIDITRDNSIIDQYQYQVSLNYTIDGQPSLQNVTFNIAE